MPKSWPISIFSRSHLLFPFSAATSRLFFRLLRLPTLRYINPRLKPPSPSAPARHNHCAWSHFETKKGGARSHSTPRSPNPSVACGLDGGARRPAVAGGLPDGYARHRARCPRLRRGVAPPGLASPWFATSYLYPLSRGRLACNWRIEQFSFTRWPEAVFCSSFWLRSSFWLTAVDTTGVANY